MRRLSPRAAVFNVGPWDIPIVGSDLLRTAILGMKADTIISVPEESLVRLGALFSAGHLPVVNSPYGPKEALTAAIVNNWIAVLNEVLGQANEKTRFISRHGWTVMNKTQCAPQVAYLEKLWNEVRRTKAAGKTLQQTKEALPRAATASLLPQNPRRVASGPSIAARFPFRH